jgi:hypothetical protein
MTERLLMPAAGASSTTTGTLLTLGITLDNVTLCLLENISGYYRLAATDTVVREAGIPPSRQCATLYQRLGERLGRPLWDERSYGPLLASEDLISQPPLEHIAIGMSPRPRMRIWLVGLTEGGSIAAARRALASAPLQLVGITTLTPTLTSTQLVTALGETHPEALVLVGGYDTPAPEAQEWLHHLARLVGQALERLSPGQRPALFYAGNHYCRAALEAGLRTLNGPLQFHALANVLPAADQAQPAALGVALSTYYWRLCQQMPGIEQLTQWVTPPGRLVNLEAAFAQLVQVWMAYQRLPMLHGLYCTPHWWLHVWAHEAETGVQLRFVKPGTRPAELAGWPPLQLVSGDWPMELWPPPSRCWWDRQALGPVVTPIGQVAPTALLQVLQHDLLVARRARG